MFEIIVTGHSLSLLHNTQVTATQQPHESSMAFFLRCVADAHSQHVPCAPIDMDMFSNVQIVDDPQGADPRAGELGKVA